MRVFMRVRGQSRGQIYVMLLQNRFPLNHGNGLNRPLLSRLSSLSLPPFPECERRFDVKSLFGDDRQSTADLSREDGRINLRVHISVHIYNIYMYVRYIHVHARARAARYALLKLGGVILGRFIPENRE